MGRPIRAGEGRSGGGLGRPGPGSVRGGCEHMFVGNNGIDRDHLTRLIERGRTIAEIAEEVGRGKSTVRYWMARYGLRSRNGRGPRTGNATQEAKAAGLASATFNCPTHGQTRYILEGRGYYRCAECRAERITRHRRRLKQILVTEAGGCCQLCGYDRYVGALQFHHLDPAEKRLGLAAGGLTLGIEALRAEARKCVLLCSNCHAEVEAGVTSLPATVARSALGSGLKA